LNADELFALLREDESERVEWKKAGDVERVSDDVVKTLSAYANDYARSGGGLVACGVDELIDEQGLKQPVLSGLAPKACEALRQAVIGKCQRQVSPSIVPVVETVAVSGRGRAVLLFQQERSPQVHLFQNRYYVRLRDSTRGAEPDQIHELFRQRHASQYLEGPCIEATRDDLDRVAVEEFLGRRVRPLPFEAYFEPGKRFSARADPLFTERRLPSGERIGVPQRFTILLFGRDPTRFFPGATVVFSVYEATTRAEQQAARFDITGPLVVQARHLLDRLETYVGIQIDKTQSPLNGTPNRPRYSISALTEAAMNALVHRDYEDRGPTRVTVFSDRIEFSSPGGLLPDLDPKQVAAGRSGARWRNQSLAAVMLELGLVQEDGSGIPRMITETQHVAGRDPEFIFEPGRVTVVIPAYVPGLRIDLGAATEQALVLLSIGGASIREQVEASLPGLGLDKANVVLDYAHEGYVETERQWQACAQEIRNRLRVWGDAPQVRHFHVFYRGPVAFAALVGAFIPHAKAFSMYHYGERGYERAFTVDRRFRARKD
jgi:ATP-dependent DNA helicase RecG